MAVSAGSTKGRSAPFRIDFLNGDWKRARDVLVKENIPIKYQTVASVEPYTATIHVEPEWGDKAKAALESAGVAWEKPAPYY